MDEVVSIKGKGVVQVLWKTPKASKADVLWRPPPDDCIKINVDASYMESLKAASVGIMARNSVGIVILSSWEYIG